MVPPCVLIADDVADAREVLAYALELEGYRVLQASTGREAFEQTLAHHPVAVVMDLQMPHLDGIEATRYLKSDARVRHIPVIAYTAFPLEIPSPDLFVAVLTKPCPVDLLLRTIAEHRRAPSPPHVRSVPEAAMEAGGKRSRRSIEGANAN